MRLAIPALVSALLWAGCFGTFGDGDVDPQDYLTSDDYAKWVVEVDFAMGEEPSQALLDFAKGQLESLVHKQSVEFRRSDTLAAGDAVWKDADVQAFARQHRDVQTGGDTVVTHLLFLAGGSEHDTDAGKVLGVTYGHDLIVIYGATIKESCSGNIVGGILCRPDPYFRAVLLHEFGHALGLVNNGVPMVKAHEASMCGDQPDRHHSTSTASVMYCQVETSAIILQPLQNGPPTTFDQDDRNDLRAAGGK